MKFFRSSWFFIFIILLVIGVNAGKLGMNESVKDISYNKLLKLLDENKDKNIIMTEDSNGTLYVKIGNTYYLTSISPDGATVNELLEKYPIDFAHHEKTNWISVIINIAIVAFLLLILLNYFKSSRGPVMKNVGLNQKPDTTFDEVGGLSDETKMEVNQIVNIFKHQEEAAKLGIRPSKGLLLYGPPGTGKTLLAKAIANQIGAHFFSVSGSSFVEMFVGVGAKRVRELFDEARKNAPSLIFIDEIDAVAGKRGMSNRNEERENTLNELLTQLDGTTANTKIFVIAATNRIDMLDPAFLRPGRFDYKILINLPDLEGRKQIIRIHSKNKPITNEVASQLDHIASNTIGFSGADIESLFLTAANHAFSNHRMEINMDDINHALDRTILGSASRKISDLDTKRRVAYHEAGHALIGTVTKPGSVRKATIIPRGEALGYVAPIPKELELSTKTELVNRIKMILAGGVAEMKKFGEHSIGVSGDVEQAKNIIEKMVEVGMRNGDYILSFSEKDKQKAMDDIYFEALEGCKELFVLYEKEFELLTSALLEKETLSGEEVEAIVFNKTIESENSELPLEKE